MKKQLFILTLSVLSITTCKALDFLINETAQSASINENDAVCIYLANSYRPVTKKAVDAVKAVKGQSCSARAEAALFQKHNILFKKLSKKDFTEPRYNEIYLQYLKATTK